MGVGKCIVKGNLMQWKIGQRASWKIRTFGGGSSEESGLVVSYDAEMIVVHVWRGQCSIEFLSRSRTEWTHQDKAEFGLMSEEPNVEH